MAVNQSPISRSISLPTQNVTTGSGFTQLANATSAVSQLITERINDVAIEKATTQGELDVLEGKQPENLALPFTKATKAYNKAVADTEARRQVLAAEKLINESLTINKNPATFTPETPAKFKAELEGIRSGILKNTREETRAAVTEALDKMEAHASLNILQHSIDYDNKRVKFDMQKDITGLLEARRNAAISGDEQRIAGIDAAIDASISDYATINQEINQIAPYLRADIDKHKAIDNQIAQFSKSIEQKKTAQFLSDLAENKENLPFNIWQDAVKAVVALDQEHKRLKNDINAEQLAQVKRGIETNSIQDASDILNFPDLTVPQQLTAMTTLENHQATLISNRSKLITAQQNILSGRPDWNSADTKNKMFESSIQQFEQQTGKVATLQDMESSILGLNDYPSSGLPRTAMGTNVPAFDATLEGKLTGKDPIQTAQAALIYNDMVYTKGQPNSVNLSGDALAVATLFKNLNNGGTTPDIAAQQAINTVLNATDPQIAARSDMFHKTLEKINPSTGTNKLQSKFKDIFGLDPQKFGSGEAFKLFTDIYRSNYLASNSEQSALDATKYAMRAWGTSKYFDKGYVGQPVPEKELAITQIGNAFDNQIVSNLQGFINRTKALRESDPDLNIPVIEWADKKQTITGNESEDVKVFNKLLIGNKPRIKINGHETDVVLMPSSTSRLGVGINYLFGVYDQFNNLHPLQDFTNTADGVARFMPQTLATWAPSIAEDKENKRIKEAALNVRRKEKELDINALQKKTPAWQVIFGFASPSEYLEHIATNNKNDNTRLNEIIDSLKGRSAQSTRSDSTEADNVGISMNLEP